MLGLTLCLLLTVLPIGSVSLLFEAHMDRRGPTKESCWLGTSSPSPISSASSAPSVSETMICRVRVHLSALTERASSLAQVALGPVGLAVM